MSRWAVLMCVAALIAPGLARAGTVDVLVDSNDITLSSANGATTATVTISNLSDSKQLVVSAAIPGQPGCVVKATPPVDPGRRADVTLTFEPGCHVSDGAHVALDFGTDRTPPTVTVIAAPASSTPDWNILFWSFAIGAGVAAVALGVLAAWIAGANLITCPPGKPNGPAPEVSEFKLPASRIPPGTYAYAVTSVTKGRESVRSHAAVLRLTRHRSVVVELPKFAEGMSERRVYRALHGSPFRRVGVVTDEDKQTFADNWLPLGPRTTLKGSTNWSFKDNWIASVTVGSTVIVALLAASNVLTAVLGAEPQAALGLIAVAGAVAALFVGLSPLLLKLIGDNVEVGTIGGTFAAAFATLLGTIGQITAVTWQAWELADGRRALPWVVIAIGAVVALIVVWFAIKTLWDYFQGSSTVEVSAPGVVPMDFEAADEGDQVVIDPDVWNLRLTENWRGVTGVRGADRRRDPSLSLDKIANLDVVPYGAQAESSPRTLLL